jgi:hypothetical protein
VDHDVALEARELAERGWDPDSALRVHVDVLRRGQERVCERHAVDVERIRGEGARFDRLEVGPAPAPQRAPTEGEDQRAAGPLHLAADRTGEHQPPLVVERGARLATYAEHGPSALNLD